MSRSQVDVIYLGSSPSGEDCVQVGVDDYVPCMRDECRRYREALERRFPSPPLGARFLVTRNEHDFGVYYEVAVAYDEESAEAVDYAFFVEGHLPESWEDAEVFEEDDRYAPINGCLECERSNGPSYRGGCDHGV